VSQAAGADLARVTGVVQDDQHLLARDQAAVQRSLGLHPVGNPVGWHAERVQEPPDGLAWLSRLPAGAEPAQVHVELPIGERGVLSQDRRLQLTQRRARVDAELLSKRGPQLNPSRPR
jgi:hypothetical protein